MIPPLGELYELLRADGFPIGVDDHVRIGRLLAREATWTVDTLRVAIAALVVKDVRDRPRFDACWERWLHAAQARSELDEPRLAPAKPPPSRLPWMVVAGAAIAACAIAVGFIARGQHTTVATSDKPPPAQAQPPVANTDIGSAAPPLEPPHTNVPPPRPHSQAPESTRDVQAIALATAAAGGLLLFVLATVAAVVARRRRRFLPGPWRYRVTIPPATTPTLSRLDIEDGAADLTWQAHEQGHELDVDRTVARTAAAGGMPVVAYRRPPAAPRYLVLEDVAAGTERWRFLYEELLAGLAREGVELERVTYISSPEVCRTKDGKDVPLRDLLEQMDAAIAIGDGAAAVDPLTGERADWLATLRHVPRRLWINPLPTARWSEGARAIAVDTPMEHGVAHALAALHAGVDRTDLERPYPAIIERAPGTATAQAALRTYLGERAFQLVAAVATAGAPTIAAARWLAEKLELRLEEQDWLRITALPWFTSERWPDAARDRLREALAIDAPVLAERSDALAERVLAASEPKPGSAAHLAWQLDRAERAGREVAVRALGVITATPLAHEARQRLAALGLPDRRRRWAVGSVGVACALALGGAGVLAAARVHDTGALAAYAAKASERQLEKLTADEVVVGSAWDGKFDVRVVDGNGDAVAGADVYWNNDFAENNISVPTTSDPNGVVEYGVMDTHNDEHDGTQTAALVGKDTASVAFRYHLPQRGQQTLGSLGNGGGSSAIAEVLENPAEARGTYGTTSNDAATDAVKKAIAKGTADIRALVASGNCVELEAKVNQLDKGSAPFLAQLKKGGGGALDTTIVKMQELARAEAAPVVAGCWQTAANNLAAQALTKLIQPLKKCFGDEQLPANVVITGRLDAAGRISEPAVQGVTNPAVVTCMTAQVKGVAVWAHDHPIGFTAPLVFASPRTPEKGGAASQRPDALDETEGNRIIDTVMPQVEECAIKTKSVTFKMMVPVGRDGRVNGLVITSDEGRASDALNACVRSVLDTLQFPPTIKGGSFLRSVNPGASRAAPKTADVEIHQLITYAADTNYTVSPDQFPILDIVVDTMKKYPDIRVRVIGHTGRADDDDDSMHWSKMRAEKVIEYLVSKGIDKSRLVAVGNPIEKPGLTDPKEIAAMRRVDFGVIPAAPASPKPPGKKR